MPRLRSPFVLLCLAAVAWAEDGEPTLEEAEAFLERAEAEYLELGSNLERASWIAATYINEDSEILAAQAAERFIAATVRYAKEASRYNGVELPEEVRRKLDMLRSGIVMPAPRDPEKTAEQAEIGTRLGAMYGKGEYCYASGDCLDLAHLGDIMAESRDPDALLEAWNGWRQVSPPMKMLPPLRMAPHEIGSPAKNALPASRLRPA